MQEGEARPHDHGLPPALYVISGASFAAALSARALDPVLPHVAEDFGVSIATAAGFAAVFAFTFSIIQPIIGAAADLFGKTRLMIGCLALLGLANILGALSSSFSVLFATRILAGIGSGGVFPVALSLTSDLVGPDKRQVAISRTLAGAMTGNLLGASASGLIGDFLGWRGVLAVLGALVIVASIAVAAGFHGAKVKHPPKMSLSALKAGYRTIFTNPNAYVCYSAVFIEGCCVLGLFPYIASFLFELGQTSLSIAGIVIAGFAVGGLFYTLTVSRLLPWLGVKGMMIAGMTLVASQLVAVALGPRWEVQALNLIVMGWGFYIAHGCLQVFASELSVEARRHRAVAAFVLLLHGADRRAARLWLRAPARRQDADAVRERRDHGGAGPRLRPTAQAARAGGCALTSRGPGVGCRPTMTPSVAYAWHTNCF
ncbi:putative MFS family arabinose efflux permease [Bradyrhizobium liaoningense]